MIFTSGETRLRHAAIDHAIEDFSTVLDVNNEEHGHISPDKAQLYKNLLDHLSVPNVRFGVASMSKRALRDENYIPIWPLKPKEKLRRNNSQSLPMPFQQERITKHSDLFDNTACAAPSLASFGTQFSFRAPAPIEIQYDEEAKVVSSIYLEPSPSQTLQHIIGRPMVVLNFFSKANVESSHRPDTIAHELEHVEQNIRTPVKRFTTASQLYDGMLSEELAAQRAQIPVLEELYRKGRGNEDKCAYTHTQLRTIKNETLDAQYDKEGRIMVDANYRACLKQRLAIMSIGPIEVIPGIKF